MVSYDGLFVTHVAFSSYCLYTNNENYIISKIKSHREQLTYFPILPSLGFQLIIWHMKAAGRLIQSATRTK